MAENIRISATTIKQYLTSIEDCIARRSIRDAMLKSKGRWIYNQSGTSVTWPVKFRRVDLEVNTGEQPREYQAKNRFKTAELAWSGYEMTDFMSKLDKLKNRDKQALVKLFENTAEMMKEDFTERWGREFYVDSGATGNSQRWTGIESFLGYSGTINITSGAARSYNAADVVGSPNDTYAGLACALGNYGGAWDTGTDINTVWPFGTGTEDYDFWTPVIVNEVSTAFGSPSTWAANGEKITRYTIDAINGRRGNSTVDLVLMPSGKFRQFKDLQASKERIIVQKSKAYDLGFTDSMMLDGVDIASDFYVPNNAAYVMSCENITVMSMQSQLLESSGPQWDQDRNGYKWLIDCLGNYRFKSPGCFGKIATLS